MSRKIKFILVAVLMLPSLSWAVKPLQTRITISKEIADKIFWDLELVQEGDTFTLHGCTDRELFKKLDIKIEKQEQSIKPSNYKDNGYKAIGYRITADKDAVKRLNEGNLSKKVKGDSDYLLSERTPKLKLLPEEHADLKIGLFYNDGDKKDIFSPLLVDVFPGIDSKAQKAAEIALKQIEEKEKLEAAKKTAKDDHDKEEKANLNKELGEKKDELKKCGNNSDEKLPIIKQIIEICQKLGNSTEEGKAEKEKKKL